MITSPTSSSSSSDPPPRRKRVSAEHTLNRVRENQRRHRARRKDHIATLEEKLAATEKLLEEARAEIVRLRAEQAGTQWNLGFALVETSSGGIDTRDNIRMEGLDDVDGEGEVQDNTVRLEVSEDVDLSQPSLPAPTTSRVLQNPLPNSSPRLQISTRIWARSGPPPCCLDEPFGLPTASDLSDSNDPECRTCRTRPPPAPTESTTLCSQAYVLIAQQNFRGIDATTIRMWLFQGFRRAQREGEGCRVENTALMSLLDFISGCEERVGVPCGHQSTDGAESHDSLFC